MTSRTRRASGGRPEDRAVRRARADLGRLIERVAAGNQAAFEELYRRTAGSVYSLVRRVVPDDAASAETTQDIYVRVWSSAHTYRRTLGSADNWLFTLTHRCAVDRIRASDDRSIHPHPERQVSLLADIAGPSARRSLALLTPDQAEALELAYFGGLTHTETAQALGVDQTTFRLRIRTALSRLQQGMDPARRRHGNRPDELTRDLS